MKQLILTALFSIIQVSCPPLAQTTTFAVVFYDNCNPAAQDSITAQIADFYNCKVITLTPRKFPSVLRREDGWDAKELIRATLKYRPDSVQRIIAFTDKDLFAEKDAASSWGVFGFSMFNPGCAVISTHRLQGPALVERTVKVAIHETAHTYGAAHCSVPGCVMNTGNGYITDLDKSQKALCPNCRKAVMSWKWD